MSHELQANQVLMTFLPWVPIGNIGWYLSCLGIDEIKIYENEWGVNYTMIEFQEGHSLMMKRGVMLHG